MYAVAATVMRDRDRASDAVQDTVTHLWEIRDALDGVANLEAFCVSAVKHRCLDMLRSFHAKVSQRSVMIDDCVVGTADDVSGRIEARDALDKVQKLMGCLSENQRRVLSLSALRGLSNSEIVEVTGLSDDNVRSLLSRARRRMKELFINSK